LPKTVSASNSPVLWSRSTALLVTISYYSYHSVSLQMTHPKATTMSNNTTDDGPWLATHVGDEPCLPQ
jgi:hypothetical protein